METKTLFHIPKHERTQKNVTYLCGHSLGLQPKSTREAIEKELGVWQNFAVEGHFKEGSHWYSYHEKVSDSLGRLVGAHKTEVVAMNSLTTNLHLMLVSFFRPTKTRFKILTDAPCFPSDKYALDSALRFHGLHPRDALIKIETMPQKDDLISTEAFLATIEHHKDQTSLVFINPVNYLSGQVFDIQAISKVCKKHDIILGLDLAHSIGNIELKLHEWDIDFAIWCSYKYLNGGPGAIGGCFVHTCHHNETLPRFEGWWGTNSQTRFLMGDMFEPSTSADAWQLSNPPIILLSALRASLDIFDQTNINQLRNKGNSLTKQFINHVQQSALKDKIKIVNSYAPRGNMLSLRLKNQNQFQALQEKLMDTGIVVDYRKPDVIRASFCPLYNTLEDVNHFFQSLNLFLK